MVGFNDQVFGHWLSANESVISVDRSSGKAEAVGIGSTQGIKWHNLVNVLDIIYMNMEMSSFILWVCCLCSTFWMSKYEIANNSYCCIQKYCFCGCSKGDANKCSIPHQRIFLLCEFQVCRSFYPILTLISLWLCASFNLIAHQVGPNFWFMPQCLHFLWWNSRRHELWYLLIEPRLLADMRIVEL